ncbi:hypothetical protein NQ317_008247 [Molorchus minor]|uniref:C2H2-type domain-containing protein n=1 Tax=Molorchus minor TaxID=1323400 RepID=A0ABQ9IZR5_9CUCU|nr:hypothetical protein NQ317_008247 [Molorchus minor]
MSVKQDHVNLYEVFQFFYSLGNEDTAGWEDLKLNVANHKKELKKEMVTEDLVILKGKNTSDSLIQVGDVTTENEVKGNDPLKADWGFLIEDANVIKTNKKLKMAVKLQYNKLTSENHGHNNPEYVPVLNEATLDQDKELPVAVPWISVNDDETSNVLDQGDTGTEQSQTASPDCNDVNISCADHFMAALLDGTLHYTAKWKSSLVSHLMRHKTPSETKMFRCEECGHETKRKADLRFHMIIHKDPAEVKQFKCPHCPYTSKRNGDLKQHLMVHSTYLYKCDLIHKDKSDVPLHRCSKCPYETKIKVMLKRHLQIHRSTAELELFKCNWCQFQTRYKQCLREHLITHKDPNEIQLFECYTCGYKGKRKKDLKDHLRIHLAVRGELLHCNICPFKTQVKRSYQKHLDLHKNVSEVKMFTCGVCRYQTRRKGNLISHMRTHVKAMKLEKDGEVNFNIVQMPLVGVVKKEEIGDGVEENG